MNAINLDAARILIGAGAVSSAVIACVNGRKWAVTFLGQAPYILKSERQSPRLFGTLETAILEMKQLGLTRCEVRFDEWPGRPRRALARKTDAAETTVAGARQ